MVVDFLVTGQLMIAIQYTTPPHYIIILITDIDHNIYVHNEAIKLRKFSCISNVTTET